MALIIDWFKANQLLLTLDKMVLIKFWPNDMPFNICCDGLTLQNQRWTKFLGIFVDDELTWNKHVSNLINKLMINKNLLSLSRNLLNKSTLRSIYYAHIFSHLHYGISTWGSMIAKANCDNLYKLQKYCIRVVGKLPRNANTDRIFKDMKILRFLDIVKLELIRGDRDFPTIYCLYHLKLCLINTKVKKTNRYMTRNRETPNIQAPSSILFNKSFMCKGLSQYVTSSSELKNKKSLKSFTYSVKKLF